MLHWLLLCLWVFGVSSVKSEFNVPQRAPFINDTGLTDQVGWDQYSFFIRGKRVFLQSGEFHGFRLPVQPLWKDIMQKAKAAGLNSISVYTHWGMTNPKTGVVDLKGFTGLQPFFDAAKEAGLWIIARPGPYIKSVCVILIRSRN